MPPRSTVKSKNDSKKNTSTVPQPSSRHGRVDISSSPSVLDSVEIPVSSRRPPAKQIFVSKAPQPTTEVDLFGSSQIHDSPYISSTNQRQSFVTPPVKGKGDISSSAIPCAPISRSSHTTRGIIADNDHTDNNHNHSSDDDDMLSFTSSVHHGRAPAQNANILDKLRFTSKTVKAVSQILPPSQRIIPLFTPNSKPDSTLPPLPPSSSSTITRNTTATATDIPYSPDITPISPPQSSPLAKPAPPPATKTPKRAQRAAKTDKQMAESIDQHSQQQQDIPLSEPLLLPSSSQSSQATTRSKKATPKKATSSKRTAITNTDISIDDVQDIDTTTSHISTTTDATEHGLINSHDNDNNSSSNNNDDDDGDLVFRTSKTSLSSSATHKTPRQSSRIKFSSATPELPGRCIMKTKGKNIKNTAASTATATATSASTGTNSIQFALPQQHNHSQSDIYSILSQNQSQTQNDTQDRVDNNNNNNNSDDDHVVSDDTDLSSKPVSLQSSPQQPTKSTRGTKKKSPVDIVPSIITPTPTTNDDITLPPITTTTTRSTRKKKDTTTNNDDTSSLSNNIQTVVPKTKRPRKQIEPIETTDNTTTTTNDNNIDITPGTNIDTTIQDTGKSQKTKVKKKGKVEEDDVVSLSQHLVPSNINDSTTMKANALNQTTTTSTSTLHKYFVTTTKQITTTTTTSTTSMSDGQYGCSNNLVQPPFVDSSTICPPDHHTDNTTMNDDNSVHNDTPYCDDDDHIFFDDHDDDQHHIATTTASQSNVHTTNNMNNMGDNTTTTTTTTTITTTANNTKHNAILPSHSPLFTFTSHHSTPLASQKDDDDDDDTTLYNHHHNTILHDFTSDNNLFDTTSDTNSISSSQTATSSKRSNARSKATTTQPSSPVLSSLSAIPSHTTTTTTRSSSRKSKRSSSALSSPLLKAGTGEMDPSTVMATPLPRRSSRRKSDADTDIDTDRDQYDRTSLKMNTVTKDIPRDIDNDNSNNKPGDHNDGHDDDDDIDIDLDHIDWTTIDDDFTYDEDGNPTHLTHYLAFRKILSQMDNDDLYMQYKDVINNYIDNMSLLSPSSLPVGDLDLLVNNDNNNNDDKIVNNKPDINTLHQIYTSHVTVSSSSSLSSSLSSDTKSYLDSIAKVTLPQTTTTVDDSPSSSTAPSHADLIAMMFGQSLSTLPDNTSNSKQMRSHHSSSHHNPLPQSSVENDTWANHIIQEQNATKIATEDFSTSYIETSESVSHHRLFDPSPCPQTAYTKVPQLPSNPCIIPHPHHSADNNTEGSSSSTTSTCQDVSTSMPLLDSLPITAPTIPSLLSTMMSTGPLGTMWGTQRRATAIRQWYRTMTSIRLLKPFSSLWVPFKHMFKSTALDVMKKASVTSRRSFHSRLASIGTAKKRTSQSNRRSAFGSIKSKNIFTLHGLSYAQLAALMRASSSSLSLYDVRSLLMHIITRQYYQLDGKDYTSVIKSKVDRIIRHPSPSVAALLAAPFASLRPIKAVYNKDDIALTSYNMKPVYLAPQQRQFMHFMTENGSVPLFPNFALATQNKNVIASSYDVLPSCPGESIVTTDIDYIATLFGQKQHHQSNNNSAGSSSEATSSHHSSPPLSESSLFDTTSHGDSVQSSQSSSSSSSSRQKPPRSTRSTRSYSRLSMHELTETDIDDEDVYPPSKKSRSNDTQSTSSSLPEQQLPRLHIRHHRAQREDYIDALMKSGQYLSPSDTPLRHEPITIRTQQTTDPIGNTMYNGIHAPVVGALYTTSMPTLHSRDTYIDPSTAASSVPLSNQLDLMGEKFTVSYTSSLGPVLNKLSTTLHNLIRDKQQQQQQQRHYNTNHDNNNKTSDHALSTPNTTTTTTMSLTSSLAGTGLYEHPLTGSITGVLPLRTDGRNMMPPPPLPSSTAPFSSYYPTPSMMPKYKDYRDINRNSHAIMVMNTYPDHYEIINTSYSIGTLHNNIHSNIKLDPSSIYNEYKDIYNNITNNPINNSHRSSSASSSNNNGIEINDSTTTTTIMSDDQ